MTEPGSQNLCCSSFNPKTDFYIFYSANILLDSKFEPRLGDFGLVQEGLKKRYTSVKESTVHGSRPYLPEEFLRDQHFSIEVDTYSFGIVSNNLHSK